MQDEQDRETQPEEGTPPDGSAAEEASRSAVPIGALGTREVLVSLLGVMAAKAWEGMGLVASMTTGKVEKDLESARLAIDAYAAVFEVLRSRLEDAPRREMETLLTNLRLNFVEKSS